MRPPASIKAWLTIEEMFTWLQNARDHDQYQRRMAIWLTHTGRLHARIVAQALGVATQTVWLWIGQYNTHGPSGLDRVGRGGRRRALLSRVEEIKIIQQARKNSRPGRSVTKRIKQLAEHKLRRPVSLSYVYHLLARHGETTVPVPVEHPEPPGGFRTQSQPWRREP